MSELRVERSSLTAVDWLLSVSLGIVLGLALLLATAGGIAIFQRDAPSYLSSSESLASGLGYKTPYGDPGKAVDFDDTTSPVVDFPPGYPVALRLGLTMGGGSETVARFGASVLVVALSSAVYFIARQGQRSRLAAALASLIAALLTLRFSTSALSEPLYGFVTVVTLAVTARYIRTVRTADLLAATLLAAVATTVRTAGMAVVGTVALTVWFVMRGRGVLRIAAPFAVAGVGAATFLLAASFGTRSFAWHAPDLNSLKVFLSSVIGWIVPPIGPPVLQLLVAAFLIGGLGVLPVVKAGGATAVAGIGSTHDPSFPALASAGGHLLQILITSLFLAVQVGFDPRQLYPVALSLLIALVITSKREASESTRPATRGFLILGVCCVVATGWIAGQVLQEARRGELGFNSASFRESVPVQFLVDSVPGESVFGNVPDGLWVAGLENTRPIPVVYNPLTHAPNTILDEEMESLRDLVAGGATLFYYRGHEREYMVSESDLRILAPCVVLDDGVSVVLAARTNPICPTK